MAYIFDTVFIFPCGFRFDVFGEKSKDQPAFRPEKPAGNTGQGSVSKSIITLCRIDDVM